MRTLSDVAPRGGSLTPERTRALIGEACPVQAYRGKRVLLVVPDATRTCPLGLIFDGLFEQIGTVTASFDVMIALGTHQPMSDAAICERLEISSQARHGKYARVRFFNHEWDNDAALRQIGELTLDDTRRLTGGLFGVAVPVKINSRIFEYDQIVICGPVFPHEVVGFSGGNKYLFPGIGGPEVLNFFHWLGAVVTNPMIIGNKRTPVRNVVDRIGQMVGVPKLCLCLVVDQGQLAGLFIGSPESAWDEASDLSKQRHVIYKDRPFHTVLSCAPRMYDELWVGGKCMYKLEPVVQDGGELIIYAPHIHELSATHGKLIRQVGYHCRDYFLKQWDRFKDVPWGVLAHCTHVRGIGTFEQGVERGRIQVTLATGIPEHVCREINLGYRDPQSIDPAEFTDREGDGVLCVPKAGELLFHLKQRPPWASDASDPSDTSDAFATDVPVAKHMTVP